MVNNIILDENIKTKTNTFRIKKYYNKKFEVGAIFAFERISKRKNLKKKSPKRTELFQLIRQNKNILTVNRSYMGTGRMPHKKEEKITLIVANIIPRGW